MIVDILLGSAPELKKIFILHKPTEKKLKEFGLYDSLVGCSSIELHPRYDYFKFIGLVRGSEFLITDGGSNQEECSYLGLPCLLMRKATERVEGLGENTVLSGYDASVVSNFMRNYKEYRRPAKVLIESPSQIIVNALQKFI